MTGIKFVPTSEMRVSLRTEECAERIWERGSGAPLVPVQRHAAIDYKIVKIGENLILILTLAEKCDIMDLRSDSADVEVKGFFRSALDVT